MPEAQEGQDVDAGKVRVATSTPWRLVRQLLVCLLLFLLTASLAQEYAALRITHLSPDAPEIDILIDDVPLFRDVGFGMNTGYLLLPAGEHEVTMYPHRHPRQPTPLPEPEQTAQATTEGTSADAPEPASRPRVQPLEPITTIVTLRSGGYYTAALVGFFEPPPEEGQLGNLTVNVSPPDSEITITGPRGYVARPMSDTNLSNLEPGLYVVRATRSGYQSARYEVEVQPGLGTVVSVTLQRGEDPDEDVVDDPEDILEALREEQVDQLVWHRTELQLYRDEIPGFPAAGAAFVRVVHASPITNGLDVSIIPLPEPEEATDTEVPRIITDLTFPNNSTYESVPAARYHLRFFASGTDYIVAELPEFELEPGVIYSFYLVGNVDDNYLRLLSRVDGVVHRSLP